MQHFVIPWATSLQLFENQVKIAQLLGVNMELPELSMAKICMESLFMHLWWATDPNCLLQVADLGSFGPTQVSDFAQKICGVWGSAQRSESDPQGFKTHDRL